jgi:phage gp46-like protein
MSWRIRLRADEGCEEQPFLTPDLIIYPDETGGAYLDFALAEPQERRNNGGLRAREALQTAVVIQLFSDARAYDDDVLPDVLDPDRRGWFGDGFARIEEQGNYNVGSRLWLLRRSILNDETVARAREMVVEALQPIVDQGAVARFDVEVESSHVRSAYIGAEAGILMIGVTGYDVSGSSTYATKFEVLWQQVREMRGSPTRGFHY